eukprot:131033_1
MSTHYNTNYSTSLFDILISNKICERYEVKFRMNATCGIVGYVTSKRCIKNWDHGLGFYDNKNSSVGIYVSGSDLSINDKNNDGKRLNVKGFRTGSILCFTFDFKNDKVEIYHNHSAIGDISLHGNKKIIVGCSLKYINDSVQIVSA